jgi:HEAT repeat protein
VSSETDVLLGLIWKASLWLSAVSLVVALLLAVKRWFEERAVARKAARQQEISRLVQALLASPRAPDATSVPPLLPGDEPALFSVALDILRVTRGRDAERMRILTEIWNLRPYLKRVLARGSRNQKIRVLTLLAHYTDEESLELLLQHVEADSIYVQLAALRGVAERGNVGHLAHVLKALARSRETNVPLLTDILRRFGQQAVPALEELSVRAVAPGIRYAAISALGEIGSLQAFQLLCELARGAEEAGARVRALKSLAQLGDPRAEAAIREAMSDENERVRSAAAEAAGRLRLRMLLPALANALGDKAWDVRYRAAESLYHLGAPGVATLQAVIHDAIDDEGERHSSMAAEIAAELLAEKMGARA